MHRGLQGHMVTVRISPEPFQAYMPRPLPPSPPLVLDGALANQLERANRALGRLDGMAALIPDPALFLYFYVRKEAVLSSQIEGTQSSLADLLFFESHAAPAVPLQDVEEVSSYVAAAAHGLRRIREEFPLNGRLLREIHGILLSSGRGADKRPREFRRSQNWIGGSRPGNARFVPPPPQEVPECLSALEKFIHNIPETTPTLIKAALAHVQFETIHPFLDGNGRLGRLLISLILCYERALREPLLYLSLHFKTHRQEYYEQLQRVRIDGDWEGWLLFFLEGVESTADSGANTAHRILELFGRDRARLEESERVSRSALRLHQLLQRKPVVATAEVVEALRLTKPTVGAAMDQLAALGIVREVTGRVRSRLFVYDEYLKALGEGTEPL